MAFNIWAPQGQLSGLTSYCNPNVIYDTNPQVLGGTHVFKMWCGQNNGIDGVWYFESADGLTSWTAYSGNPVVAGPNTPKASFPTVYKVGTTYYLYTSAYSAGTNLQVRTSTDGITWGAPATAIAAGTGGDWDVNGLAQLNLVPGTPGFGTNTGETYYAYYSGLNTHNDIGLVTTTNLAGQWTKSTSPANPIFTFTAPGAFQHIDGTYYMWAPHGDPVPVSLSSQGKDFNCLQRWSSPTPSGPWTPLFFNSQGVGVIYCSIRADFDISGTNTNTSGTNISDPSIVYALGNLYIYWGFTYAVGTQKGVNAAIATGVSPSQQVSGYEGMVGFPIPNGTNLPMNLNTLATDTFQRPDANPIGGNWTVLNVAYTAAQIVSHFVEGGVAGAGGDSYYNAVSFPNDQWSMTTINTNNASYHGAWVRMNTAGSNIGYRIYWHGAGNLGTTQTLAMDKNLPTNTATGNLSLKVSANDTLMLAMSGSNMLAYYNGYPVLAFTDANVASGAAGFEILGATNVANCKISAWSGGGFVAAPAVPSTGSSSGSLSLRRRKRRDVIS